MKYLCIGDPHIKIDNIDQIDRLEAHIIALMNGELAREEVTIVVLGDVLHHHERLHTLALNRALRFIQNLSEYSPVFVLVGNHDYIQNDQFLSENHWMNSIKSWPRVTVVDKFTFDSSNCVFLPYVPPGRFFEALDTGAEWRGAKLIFAHQEFCGAQMRGHVSTCGDEWNKDLPRVISGHIHTRQILDSGVLYVGSPVPGNAQSGDFSLTLADSESAPHTWRQFPLLFPRAKSVTMQIDGITAEWIASIQEQTYRVVVQGESLEQFKIFQQSALCARLVEQGNRVVFKRTSVCAAPKEAPTGAAQTTFESLLFKNILARQDVWLYAAAQHVLGTPDVNEEDLLIVPLITNA